MRDRKLLRVAILLVILAAFALRMHRLGSDASFTTDEVTTVTGSMGSLAALWERQSGTPLQALWIKFGVQGLGLGDSEFAVYFMSVLTGVLAVAVAYRLGTSMFGGRVGLLAAFFLAFSAYHVYWSRSARYYSMMVFLSLAAFFCLYRALATNQRRAWLGYALFRTLSLYDHLTAVWILAGEGLFALAYVLLPAWRRFWQQQRAAGLFRPWSGIKDVLRAGALRRSLLSSRFFWLALALALILLAYAPRWYPLARNVVAGNSWLRVGTLSAEPALPTGARYSQPQPVLGGGWRGPFLVLSLLDAWIAPLHMLMMMGFAGGLLVSAWRRQWRPLLFVLTLVVTPFVLMSVGKSYQIVVNGRYLISILPLYLLMAGRGFSGASQLLVQTIHDRGRRVAFSPWTTLAVVALAYAGMSFTRVPLTYRNTGQNWRVASEFLTQVAQPDDKIVVHGKSTFAAALQFYLPDFTVIAKNPRLSYDAIFDGQAQGWLVFHPGTDMYTERRAWIDKAKAIALVFRGAWYPDIDRATDLAPAQNWDLYVVRVSPGITSTEQALAMHRAWLVQAEARNPDDVRHHFTLAEAYRRFDRPAEAVREYGLALGEGYVNDQLASYIYDARATCWAQLGRTEEAVADWQRAIARAAWSGTPYEHLGDAYSRLGRIGDAEALYRRAIAANPDEAWPRVLLGDAYRSRGLAVEAVAEYQKAIDLDPGDGDAYQHLAEIYAAQGEQARVVSLLRDAVRRNPSSGWPHYDLGQYYRSLGQVTNAVAEYQHAVDLQPEYAANASAFLRDARWDLASALNLVHAYSDAADLLWWPGNTWVKPLPYEQDVLVGRSTLTVQGQVRPDQIFLHPFGDRQDTYVEFQIPANPFVDLQVGFALADQVTKESNGVRYIIEVKRGDSAEWWPVFGQDVVDNVWQEQTISLLPFWNEDLSFRLAVDARGDYVYDWLQSTVQLVPAPSVWDLSAHLREARFVADSTPLGWQGDGFYTADGRRLVGRSDLPVRGHTLPGQVMFHPFDAGAASTLLFSLEENSYHVLKTSFGLADQALSQSDGVEYTVSVSVDGGASFVDLVHTTVAGDTVGSELVDLPASGELVLKLTSSARQAATFDWLQVNLVLLPLDGDRTASELNLPVEVSP